MPSVNGSQATNPHNLHVPCNLSGPALMEQQFYANGPQQEQQPFIQDNTMSAALCYNQDLLPGKAQLQGHVQNLQQTPKVSKDARGRELAPCGCLKRTLPPDPPANPPFPITEDNVPKIQSWILDQYASSAFNTCPHQPLPLMSGLPPLRLILKDGAEPKAIHKPATVPAHWEEQVRRDLEQDIALGVLERVPSNTPTIWCSRMHVVGKKNGEPRRVVDLRQVNAATERQTHYTEPPFMQAMGVPPNT